MADNDQFTFEDDDDFPGTSIKAEEEPEGFDLGDDDDFPETDLSAAFSDGEQEAENPAPEIQEEPEPDEMAGKVEQPKKEGGGGSKTRTLLMVLLLVIVGGAGVYYFMGLGESTPSVPTAQAPAKKATKAVALPPKPPVKAQTKAPTPAKAPEKVQPVTVAAPSPPAQPVAKPVAKTVAKPTPVVKSAAKPIAATKPKAAPAAKPAPVKQPVKTVAVSAPKPTPAQKQPVAVKPAASTSAPQKTVVKAPAAVETAMPVKQVAGGFYALDAGSYLFESNRKTLVAKIKSLGYKALVTPVDATLDMIRLRLGTFSKNEVKESLDLARSIEPGSYSSPAGDGYVIYAGTFLRSVNVDKLKQKFLDEGIKVYSEPVQVVRTLSRVRFGSFATKEDAASAALEASKAGLKAVVVKAN
jgi:cell division septation protein DedD